MEMQPNKASCNSTVFEECRSDFLLHDELSKTTRALVESDPKLSVSFNNAETQDCCDESLKQQIRTHYARLAFEVLCR